MHSPIQRWLSNPSNARWEQPSYDSLALLNTTSAVLRQRQALQLFEHDVFSICKRISALRWAKRYMDLAYPLVNTFPNVFNCLDPAHWSLQCLYHAARFPRTEWPDSKLRQHAGRAAQEMLRGLGAEHPLSQAFVQVMFLQTEQISFWRDTFPSDPIDEKMNIALHLGQVRRLDLDGYLRARKYLLVQESFDLVDLSSLNLDHFE